MSLWQWSFKEQPDHIEPWNQVIADKHAAYTERLLTGWCGPARIVGDRVVERREAMLAKRREQDAHLDREWSQLQEK